MFEEIKQSPALLFVDFSEWCYDLREIFVR